MDTLQDKVAVVTGAANGIGRGIARALAARGCAVVAADVDVGGAEAVAREVAGRGVRSLAVRCDVTEPAALEALAERAWSELGRVDVLCNNAGVGTTNLVTDTSANDVQWIFAVNVFGVLHGCAAFVPRFRAAGRPAHILNTGSEHSLGVPFPGMGVYTASKHAVLGLSDVLRRELAGFEIGVSVLCPAVVRTEIWNAGRTRAERFGGPVQSPEQFRLFMEAGMDPDEVGRIAVAGIERNDFLILTHPEVRAIAEERARAVLGAFDAYFPRT
jgi:NAD(P)-dependent dehydrogenase (short-subunit alcohol dehydrogenase family)